MSTDVIAIDLLDSFDTPSVIDEVTEAPVTAAIESSQDLETV